MHSNVLLLMYCFLARFDYSLFVICIDEKIFKKYDHILG